MTKHLHERRFSGDADRLRRPERMALLEVELVVELSIEGLKVKNLLDVGTGTGIFAEAFTKHKIQVTGIDPNIELLEIAKSIVPEAQFQKGVAEDIPYPDDSFDIVILIHVLHETDNIFKALTEAKRVARKRVVVLEWPYLDEEQGPPIEHRLKSEEIEKNATAAGFHIEKFQLKHMDFYRLNPSH
ncbi:MAG: class I SAM-dependent methyltransferase [Ignavibacteriales bacterium]|nr:class I SAM-dependent methyltransferase [Ignavibacteriales bacterium]